MLALIAAICKLPIQNKDTELKSKFIGGLGINNKIPWKLKKDLEFFKNVTSHSVIIMGANTYKSIGRILPNRTNIIVSTKLNIPGAIMMRNLKQVNNYIKNNHEKKNIFIIGGQSLYSKYINSPLCSEIYLTTIEKYFECDTFFPEISNKYNLVYASEIENGIDFNYRFLKFKKNKDLKNEYTEVPFLELGNYILNKGHLKKNRTNIDTISTFSYQLKFNIRNSVPLLTTKYVPWKTCIEELLWFLRGETDVKILQNKGIKIWNGNTSREFLDNMGFYDVPEWDLRYGYGHQIRRFGPNKVDQLKYVENLLKTDPNSRRIMWNLWNANDLDKMVLTPCFLKGNYTVTKEGYKLIEDIQESDYLLTHEGKYEKCLNIQKSIYKDLVYTIKFNNNPYYITCTKEHLFYVCEKDNLNNKNWIQAEKLNKNIHLLCSKINKQEHYDPIDIYSFDEIKEHKIWFIIGFLFENYRLSHSDQKIVLELKNQDQELLQYLSSFKYKSITCECCDSIKIIINDKMIYTILNYFNKYKSIPELVQRLPVNEILDFLKGYEIYNKNIIKNKLQVLSLQRLYAKCGKFIIVQKINSENYLIKSKEDLKDSEYIYYQISGIDIYKENNGVDVYNLETEKDHTYTVSNCITHNCHNQVQFYVKDNKYLSAQLYCRSSDYFLGLPFNIFSYTVLVYILAKKCGLIPDELIVTLGDAHIYTNHILQVKKMMLNSQRSLPSLIISDSIKNKNYEEITINDFSVVGYFPHTVIKASMAV